jgi:hypothetical protein
VCRQAFERCGGQSLIRYTGAVYPASAQPFQGGQPGRRGLSGNTCGGPEIRGTGKPHDFQFAEPFDRPVADSGPSRLMELTASDSHPLQDQNVGSVQDAHARQLHLILGCLTQKKRPAVQLCCVGTQSMTSDGHARFALWLRHCHALDNGRAHK